MTLLAIIAYRLSVKRIQMRPLNRLSSHARNAPHVPRPLADLPLTHDDLPDNRSAAAVVADALRQAILAGALAGGERLRQDAVATRFAVSQMIAREAFRQLVSEGFLKALPRRGVSVAPLTSDEAAEMTQLRSLIESQALAWAIPAQTPGDLAAAERHLAALDAATATDAIIGLNARFHAALYAPARRERTLALIATLRLNFERYLRFTWEETPHRAQSQREHRELLTLCKARDVGGACRLLKQHITATGALLVERLKARGGVGA
jgi:DNA-binding GntR family transcriptional regulator